MPDRIRHRLAHLRPRVEEESAIDQPVRVWDGGRPVPEEATGGGEDYGGDAEGPDEEVGEEVEGRVEGAARADGEEGEEEDVGEEGEGGLGGGRDVSGLKSMRGDRSGRVVEMGRWLAGGDGEETYRGNCQPIRPITVSACIDKVLVCDGDSNGKEDEGNGGEDDC